jgi:hypothetical protein
LVDKFSSESLLFHCSIIKLFFEKIDFTNDSNLFSPINSFPEKDSEENQCVKFQFKNCSKIDLVEYLKRPKLENHFRSFIWTQEFLFYLMVLHQRLYLNDQTFIEGK